MPCIELPSSYTTLETKRWTLCFACEKNQQLSCCWSEKFPTTSDAGTYELGWDFFRFLLPLEDLQPYLEYGKKAFDAIMSGCLEEITKGAIKTNGAGRKKDMEEKAAAIEGHCTFVWGNQVRCACVKKKTIKSPECQDFKIDYIFSLHNVCENLLLITRCEIWIDLVYQVVFHCMSCFFFSNHVMRSWKNRSSGRFPELLVRWDWIPEEMPMECPGCCIPPFFFWGVKHGTWKGDAVWGGKACCNYTVCLFVCLFFFE